MAAKKTTTKKTAKRRKTAAKKTARRRLPLPVHVQAAEKYVSDVLDGRIDACRWVKLACERHRRDMASSISKDFPFRFDPEAGDRPCRFFEKLPHVKGKWARRDPMTGKPSTLTLEGWQAFCLVSIFGWVRKDNGKRRFRKSRIYVPRKNGKTFLMAAAALYMLCCDGEVGPEVYCGATSQDQALILFKMVRQICLKSPDLVAKFGLTINVASIIREADGAIFKPVIGKPGDGDSPHCAITDEYHEHPTSDQLDTMETGMGAREQPLSLVISTAGSNAAGPCREDWKNCELILAGTDGFQDDTTFAIVFTIDDEDRWDCEASLRKANPNFGISIEVNAILADMRVAQQRANKQSAFKTKHLNLWVSVKIAYYNAAAWENLARPKIKREDYKEFPSYLGGDFASHLDITSVMQIFLLGDGRFALFGNHYLPENTIDLPQNQHYRNWRIQGWLQVAGESTMDFDTVREDIFEIHRDYQVQEFAIDPTRMWGETAKLAAEGVPLVEYRQTTLMMSEPMKKLEALIESGRIIHNGDPILAWAIGNVVAKEDAKSNVFPRKEGNTNKIDPVISTLFALGRAMTRPEEMAGSFFAF